MKLITIEILLFYDQAHLLTAKGENEEIYLCLLVEVLKDGTNMYIGTPISKSRLSMLLAGQIDVRLIYTQPETFIFLQISESIDGLLVGNELAVKAIPEEYLPEIDLFLSDQLESGDLSEFQKFTHDPKSKIDLPLFEVVVEKTKGPSKAVTRKPEDCSGEYTFNLIAAPGGRIIPTGSTPARFTGAFSWIENEASIYLVPTKPAQNGKIRAERKLVFR